MAAAHRRHAEQREEHDGDERRGGNRDGFGHPPGGHQHADGGGAPGEYGHAFWWRQEECGREQQRSGRPARPVRASPCVVLQLRPRSPGSPLVELIAEHAHLALRKRNLEAVLAQRFEDQQQEVAADAVLAVVDAVHPELDEHVDAGIAEAGDLAVGPFLDRHVVAADDLRVGGDHALDDRDQRPDVGVVGDGEVDAVALFLVLVRPVGEGLDDELLVGDHHVLAVEGLERGRAHVQLAHDAGAAVFELDVVVDRHRPIQQDDDPRDEVRGDRLQAETQADAHCAAEHGQRRQVDAHHLQEQQEHDRDDRHLEGLRGHLPRALIELLLAADDVLAGAVREAAQPEQQRVRRAWPGSARRATRGCCRSSAQSNRGSRSGARAGRRSGGRARTGPATAATSPGPCS